jgi:hypothetical protein
VPVRDYDRYLRSVLVRLGYRPKLVGPQPRGSVGIYANGWAADFKLGSGFDGAMCLAGVIRCSSDLEREIERALAVEHRNPTASNRLWARLDRKITDQALVVPLFNDKPLLMVSARVHGYQGSSNGVIYKDQFWIK